METKIHQRENSEETETFLQENIGKFEANAVFLLKLMRTGVRLSAKDVMQKYGIHDRRLRDLEISGRCQKEWVMKENGKRSHVEYFIPVPHRPTKQEVIEKTAKVISLLKQTESNLVTVFSLPDIAEQGSLFK
jgi:hypothetical protein